MYSTRDLQSIMAQAHHQAAFSKKPLEKSFFPRLARYSKELLEEGFHPQDIQFAVRRVIEGGHSPYLLRSMVQDRLQPRTPVNEYEQTTVDFPDYSYGR